MQIPIRLAALFSLAFAGICLWFAIDGFTSLPDADPDQASGGRSFAWFWTFLAAVGFAMAWLSWKLGNAPAKDEDA